MDINVFQEKKKKKENGRGSRATASYARMMRNEAKWSAMKKNKKKAGEGRREHIVRAREGRGREEGGTSSQMRLYLHFERGGVFVLDRRQTQIMSCDLKCN